MKFSKLFIATFVLLLASCSSDKTVEPVEPENNPSAETVTNIVANKSAEAFVETSLAASLTEEGAAKVCDYYTDATLFVFYGSSDDAAKAYCRKANALAVADVGNLDLSNLQYKRMNYKKVKLDNFTKEGRLILLELLRRTSPLQPVVIVVKGNAVDEDGVKAAINSYYYVLQDDTGWKELVRFDV